MSSNRRKRDENGQFLPAPGVIETKTLLTEIFHCGLVTLPIPQGVKLIVRSGPYLLGLIKPAGVT